MATRHPRILGWRLVLVGVVVGVVLNILSVPICALLSPPSPRINGWGDPAYVTIRVEDGAMHRIDRYEGPGALAWETHYSPEPFGFVDPALIRYGRDAASRDDPRPPRARAPMFEVECATAYTVYGFPWRAAWSRCGVGTVDRSLSRNEGLAELSIMGRAWGVPVRPLWSGLFLNTLFYAALIIVPVVAIRWFKRARRRRRTRCVACGYDVSGGGNVCPECGTTRPPN